MILDKYFLEQATNSSFRPVHSATSHCKDCVYSRRTLFPPFAVAMLSVCSGFSSDKKKTVLMMAS